MFPEGASTGVVALDMSASISGPMYARVATTLRGIVNANQSVGLIMFSDTAYELLPPNSPPGAMLQFIPFFVPLRYYGSTPVFGQTPWDTFMGGTRVGEGLEMARLALKRAHVKHGAILLVSDLDDSNADQGLLEQEALQLRAEHIPVRIVPLFAAPRDRRLFAALFGDKAFVDPSVFTHTAKRHAAAVAAPQPWMLLLLGAAARRAARRQRALQRAAHRTGRGGMKTQLRRHRSALLALLLACVALVLGLLAADVHAWQTTVARDDLRFRALPAHKGLWQPADRSSPATPPRVSSAPAARSRTAARCSTSGSPASAAIPRCGRTRRRCAPPRRRRSRA